MRYIMYIIVREIKMKIEWRVFVCAIDRYTILLGFPFQDRGVTHFRSCTFFLQINVNNPNNFPQRLIVDPVNTRAVAF